MCLFCRSLFVPLYFFFWPLCCLIFFDMRILFTPLVSNSNSSHTMYVTKRAAVASVATILVTVLVLIWAHLVVTARNWISNAILYIVFCHSSNIWGGRWLFHLFILIELFTILYEFTLFIILYEFRRQVEFSQHVTQCCWIN